MRYRTKNIDGIEVSFSADWIDELESQVHFNWYYQQAKLVYDNCDRTDSILEIGIGTGLLSDLLRRRRWQITTLDIDEEKHPDICESASEFDYSSLDVNVVLAFEVFEHIPFATFENVIKCLSQAHVDRVFFSLPWNEYQLLDFKLTLPFLKEMKIAWSLSKRKITTHAHFWELAKRARTFPDKKLVKLEQMVSFFESQGFKVTPLVKVGCIQYFQAKNTN